MMVGFWQVLLILAIIMVPELVLIWLGVRKARPENALSRGTYAKRIILITAALLTLLIVEAIMRAEVPDSILLAAGISVFVATLVWTVLRARYTALRLYDRGRAKPNLAYLLAIPLVGFVLTVYLMFAPSRPPVDKESNPQLGRGDAFRRPSSGWAG